MIRVNPRALEAAARLCYGKNHDRAWADLSPDDRKAVLAWLADFLREFDRAKGEDLIMRGRRPPADGKAPSPAPGCNSSAPLQEGALL
jgi:hypothetical protein